MGRISTLGITALCLGALIVACDSGPESESAGTAEAPADTAATAATAATSGGPPARIDQSAPPCPRTGRWALCSVEKRLEQSGFVLRKQEESSGRAGFSVQPAVYTLGRARLEVFIYPDEVALGRDVAKLDTALAAPRGQAGDWDIPPRYFRSANLAAVLLTRNEQQAERVTLALTAGPPQSGP
ncbi:MAG TPA: hypothetical protein VNO75_04795 [Gemmatimonadaceae bacterium]|nr:hypothetical protein [Gemmatimonadaceae bacterium]